MNRTRLGDLIKLDAFKKVPKSWDEITYFNTGSITAGELISPQSLKKGVDKVPNAAKFILEQDSIVYSTRRPLQHHHAYIRVNDLPEHSVFSNFFFGIRALETVDLFYLYSLLISPAVTERLNTIATANSSTYPFLNPKDLESLLIDICDLPQQRNISSIGRTLDSIVTNLKNQIKELEILSQDLYDYWFIQFDFPDENGNLYRYSGGKMVWNDQLKQEIPEGWQVKSLYEIATFTNGLACQKHRPAENDLGLPVIKIKEMTRGLSPETERVSSNIADKYKIDLGDILFSWSATLLVQRWNAIPAGLNQHIFKVEPSTGVGNGYIYLLLKHVVAEFVTIAMSRKTTMGHITQDHLRAKMVAVPPSSVTDEFEVIYAPLLAQWKTLNRQLMEYLNLKEMLMPLLLNGQANVESPSEQD